MGIIQDRVKYVRTVGYNRRLRYRGVTPLSAQPLHFFFFWPLLRSVPRCQLPSYFLAFVMNNLLPAGALFFFGAPFPLALSN
jgi:hypothetical protein